MQLKDRELSHCGDGGMKIDSYCSPHNGRLGASARKHNNNVYVLMYIQTQSQRMHVGYVMAEQLGHRNLQGVRTAVQHLGVSLWATRCRDARHTK